MAEKTSADRLRHFLAVEQAEGATDDTELVDGIDLTYGDLHQILVQSDHRAAALRVERDRTASAEKLLAEATARCDAWKGRAQALQPERDQLRAELERLRHGAEAPSGRCEDCFCCTASGCCTGTDSTCPTDRLGDSICPCTGD